MQKLFLNWQAEVQACIQDDAHLPALEKLLFDDHRKHVAIDLMVADVETHQSDFSNKFARLKLDSFLIRKLSSRPDIAPLKKLAYMKSAAAFPTLMKLADEEDLDIAYTSFFALSLIKLPKEKMILAIKKLITASFSKRPDHRTIEPFFQLTMTEWLLLLEEEKTVKGKVIYLKNLGNKPEIQQEAYSEQIVKFLQDHHEVRIAAVIALSSSKNPPLC